MSVITKSIINLFLIGFIVLIKLQIGHSQIGPNYHASLNYYNNEQSNFQKFHSDEHSEFNYPEEPPPPTSESHTEKGIPLEVLDKLNEASNLKEVFDIIYQNQSAEFNNVGLNDYSDIMERNAGVTLASATCKSREQVVSLNVSSGDPKDIFYPACVVVKRCGGCCLPAELKSCQPTETEILNVIVTKFTYPEGSSSPTRSKQIVLVEQHNKCQCGCTVKASDCNIYQEYNSRNCRCDCINIAERSKCLSNQDKLWLPQNCTCRCAERKDCTTGTYFDERDCKCKASETTRLILSERRKFIVKPIQVYPDNSTKYDTEG